MCLHLVNIYLEAFKQIFIKIYFFFQCNENTITLGSNWINVFKKTAYNFIY